MTRPGAAWAATALLIALVATVALALAIGTTPLPLGDVVRALGGDGDATTITIVRMVRLPRVILAALVGAALGLSGAALQGALRNPLAEPYILGVSGGAAVGAVIAVVAALPFVPLAALIGAVVAVVLVVGVALGAGGPARGDPRTLLMAGVVVGAFANAAILVLLATAPADTVRSALWWMMGSTAAASWPDIQLSAAALVLAGGTLWALAPRLDLLSLGAEAAASLGIHPERTIRGIFVWASVLASATVVAAGLVGFVGLVVPHVARAAAGSRHRPVLLLSALGGAVLVVAADLIARVARSPAELPLGAVTALLGVPFFLIQMRRRR